MIGTWAPNLKEFLDLADGVWTWQWQAASEQGALTAGTARLIITGCHFRWQFGGADAAGAESRRLALAPRDSLWLCIRVADRGELALTPPLPRLAVDSAFYPDLVTMVRALTTPRFGGVVTHWPAYPVPVGSPTAVSGEVDLAACLREAVEIVNAGEPEPWFEWQPAASWGVRLAYYQGSIRTPPLQIQITRRDAQNRPLAMRIAAGDNYARASRRPYAVRGLAHELTHAMLLWGHSPDRAHLLWGLAPPLRDDPSGDERRAIRLWRRLPAGLDLNRYGRLTDP